MCYFENVTFEVKTAVATFWATVSKFRILLLKHMVTLDVDDDHDVDDEGWDGHPVRGGYRNFWQRLFGTGSAQWVIYFLFWANFALVIVINNSFFFSLSI